MPEALERILMMTEEYTAIPLMEELTPLYDLLYDCRMFLGMAVCLMALFLGLTGAFIFWRLCHVR